MTTTWIAECNKNLIRQVGHFSSSLYVAIYPQETFISIQQLSDKLKTIFFGDKSNIQNHYAHKISMGITIIRKSA